MSSSGPIARWSRLRIALFVLTVAFVPFLLVLRWGVLGLGAAFRL